MPTIVRTNGLLSFEEASAVIESGAVVAVAGAEALLRRLPAGDWVGGTMRYFMTADGGRESTDRIFVTELPVEPTDIVIRSYGPDDLAEIVADAPDNGFSFIVIPADSPVHLAYAAQAPYLPGLFRTPIVGWVAGVQLRDLGRISPRAVDGRQTGRRRTDMERAVVLHARLPAGKAARIETVNMFRPGDGARITFPTDGSSATTCTVEGETRELAAYLREIGADTRLPLVADYAGAAVNTSFRSVDAASGVVTFYAPVFRGIEYRLAAPVPDYARALTTAVASVGATATFTCSCILNYVYGELEGRTVGHLAGPMTFGEIAYQLLNQTLVYLSIVDA